MYLYSPYGPYGVYRASVPVQGCTLPYLTLPLHFPERLAADEGLRNYLLPSLTESWEQFMAPNSLRMILLILNV